MKQFSLTIAILFFFALATIGALSGAGCFYSGLKAVGGAAAVYFVINILGELFLRFSSPSASQRVRGRGAEGGGGA